MANGGPVAMGVKVSKARLKRAEPSHPTRRSSRVTSQPADPDARTWLADEATDDKVQNFKYRYEPQEETRLSRASFGAWVELGYHPSNARAIAMCGGEAARVSCPLCPLLNVYSIAHCVIPIDKQKRSMTSGEWSKGHAAAARQTLSESATHSSGQPGSRLGLEN